MRVFFDTEFTGLTSDPRLLSIGLVADDGQELYIEFTNGWSATDCSFWVQENILPRLNTGERLTRRDAVTRILLWLSSFDSTPTLLGETSWDTTLLADLMKECDVPADRFSLEALAYSGKDQAIAFAGAMQDYFRTRKITPHHALTDARTFRAAWHSVCGAGLSESPEK